MIQTIQLRVLSDELSDFLNNIIKYCPAPALFREVTLILDPKHDKKDAVIGGPAFWPRFFLNNELWTQVRPIFQYIEKLNITYLSNYRNFAPRLPAFFGEFDFPNIKSLTLQHFSMEKDWKDLFLNPQMCANLTELRLFDFYIEEDINEFKKLINRLPNLEVFAHTTYGLNIDAVSEVLHQRFPNLRGFGFRTNSPIDANDGDSDDDDDQFIARYDIDGDRTITLRDEELKCLEKFKNLTEFYLDTSECQCRNLSSVFRFVPNIKVLGMWEIGLFHPEEDVHRFIGTIRQTITNRRDRFPSNNDRVHLFVNQEQFNILNSVENIKNIIRLTVQHQSRV